MNRCNTLTLCLKCPICNVGRIQTSPTSWTSMTMCRMTVSFQTETTSAEGWLHLINGKTIHLFVLQVTTEQSTETHTTISMSTAGHGLPLIPDQQFINTEILPFELNFWFSSQNGCDVCGEIFSYLQIGFGFILSTPCRPHHGMRNPGFIS